LTRDYDNIKRLARAVSYAVATSALTCTRRGPFPHHETRSRSARSTGKEFAMHQSVITTEEIAAGDPERGDHAHDGARREHGDRSRNQLR